jgi:long-chain fatty acid transport protein
MPRLARTLAALLLGLLAGRVEAAGFALREQSAAAQGNAFAGATAGADDISYMFFNPAAIGRLTTPYEIVTGATLVVPRLKLEDSRASTVLGTPIGGRTPQQDIGEDALIPATYAALRLHEQWVLGLGVNAPFGLSTDYPSGWVGRYHALHSSLRTIDLTPTLAWSPDPRLVLGLGLQVQYADADLSSAIDLGTLGAALGVPGAIPAAQDGRVQVTGDDWGYGFTMGALAEPLPGTRLGLAYRSGIEHRLSGKADFTLDGSPTGQAISTATGAFVDTGAKADLDLPAMASVGLQQQVTPGLALMAEAAWTNWSRFGQLRIEFDNPSQPASVTDEAWQDSWFLAAGATWRPAPGWLLRMGVALDQTPVRGRYRTPRLPDGDRYWLSLGLSYEPRPWVTLDLAATHIFMDDAAVRLRADNPGEQFRGDLDARYDNAIELVAAAARLRF